MGGNVAESADSPRYDEKSVLRGANLLRVSLLRRSVAKRRAASHKCLVRFGERFGETTGGDGSIGKAMKPSGRSAAALSPRNCNMGTGNVAKRGARTRTIWFGSMPITLPIEPLTVRIPVAVHLTGIRRSKIYELIKAGKLDTVKVGASTLVSVASLRRLVEKQKR